MIELRCRSSSSRLSGADELHRQLGPLGGEPPQQVGGGSVAASRGRRRSVAGSGRRERLDGRAQPSGRAAYRPDLRRRSHGLAKKEKLAPDRQRPDEPAVEQRRWSTGAAPTTYGRGRPRGAAPAIDSSSVSRATAGTSGDRRRQLAQDPAGTDLDEQVDVLGRQRDRLGEPHRVGDLAAQQVAATSVSAAQHVAR